MPPLTLPNTLTPGTFEDVGDVQENFVAIRTLVNGSLNGSNLSQATGEALAVSGTNTPRRGTLNHPFDSTETRVLTSVYQRIIRAPTVVMPTGGLLFVSAMGRMDVFAPVTWRLCVQLNGVIAKSRFGTAPASGASNGLMERTMSTAGAMTLWYTDTGDTGLGSLDAAPFESPWDISFTGRPLPVFVPIVVGPGSYVVDVLAVQDVGAALSATSTDAIIYVRTEAF